ncbi:hypothetical protein GW915_10230, partial [bacterium]|nr:hypothetical protein [bacterium]
MSKGEKLKSILSKFSGLKGLAKWIASILILFVLAIVGTVFYLEKSYPPEQFKEVISQKLKSSGAIEHFELGDLDWGFSLLNLSIRANLKDLKFDLKETPLSAEIARMEFHASLWNLLFLRLPVSLDVYDSKIEVDVTPPNAVLEETAAVSKEEAAVSIKAIPDWLRYLYAHLRIHNASLNIKGMDDYEVSEIQKINLDFVSSGFPGNYNLDLSFEPIASSEKSGVYVSGLTKVKLAGASRLQGGYFVGFSAEEYELNLNENLIVGLGFLEKTPGYKMGFQGGLNFIFSPDLVMRKVEFLNNHLFLSALQINLQAQYSADEGLSLNWALPETRVENLYLPVKYLRLLPFKGIVESKIFIGIPKKKKPTVDWQISLNNLYADVAKVEGVFDSTSSGKLLMSMTTKGRYVEGKIESPKIEVHVDATNAALLFNKGQIQKKQGDRLEILFKSIVKDNILKIQNFKGFIHTLEFQGAGRIKNFSEYMAGQSGDLDFSFITNRIHLRDWSTSLNFLVQSPPLDGFAKIGANFSGPVVLGQDNFEHINWRVDQINLTNMRGSFDPKELIRSGILPKQSYVEGRFQIDLT